MKDPILIAGAGPTGLALAVHLAMHDVPVRLIDAAAGPATTSRALGLQPRGAEVLERIGALGDLPRRAQSSLTVSYNDGPRTVVRFRVGEAVARRMKQTLLISQAEVEGALRDRYAAVGGTVDWGTRLVGVRQDDTGVTATLATSTGEHEMRADWLVGADGAHSAVRKLAGIGFPGRPLIQRLLMVDVHAHWPYDRDGSTTWMDAGRMLSVTALPGETWRVFSEPPDGLPDELADDRIADLVLAEFARRSGTDLGTVDKVLWASEFRIHRRLADSYRRGRLLLAGDAAHIQSPTGGQGQNTGLGDAENLAWKLVLVARGAADPRLIDTYEAERRPLARSVLSATSTAVGVMLPDTRWKRLVRDHVVLPVMRLPSVQRRVMLAASQLTINYRHGPLAADPGEPHRTALVPRLRHPRGPLPGDRVPDVRCHRLDGTPTTLHAALQARWAALAGDADDAVRHASRAAETLGPGLVVPLCGPTRGEVLLVRPDGHLAWRGRPAPDRMAAWLRRMAWPA